MAAGSDVGAMKQNAVPQASNRYESCIKPCAPYVYSCIMLCGVVGLIVWICKYNLSDGKDAAILASDADTVKIILILMGIFVAVLVIVSIVCLCCCCRRSEKKYGCFKHCSDSSNIIWDYTHVVIMTVAVIIQIVCGCVLVFYKCKIEYHMTEHLKENLGNYEFRPYWDRVQVEKVCCGVQGPIDYKNTTIYDYNRLYVPETCCVLTNDTDVDHPQEKNERLCQYEAQQVQEGATMITTYVKSEGCYEPILKDFRKYIETLYNVAFGFGGVEGGFLLIICCCIASS